MIAAVEKAVVMVAVVLRAINDSIINYLTVEKKHENLIN
jgi:hypothetical protein